MWTRSPKPRDAARAAALLAWSAIGGCAAAAEPPPAPATGNGIAFAFADICLLNAFPDHDPRPGLLPAGATLTPLPPAEVRRYLRSDPGRGWTYRKDGGGYVVTIEDPPFHVCAVRAAYATLPDGYQPAFRSLVQAWAGAHGRDPVQVFPPRALQNGQLLVTVWSMTMRRQTGDGVETLLDLQSQAADGTIEVRLVRRTPGPSINH